MALAVTSLTDAFNLAMESCFFAAIFIGAPFIIREIWLFIGPALYKKERRYAMPFIVSASLLFVSGVCFGYFVAFPLAAQFLIDFGIKMGLVQVIRAREYFDLFLVFELLLGIVFEIPAVIFILSRLGLVTGPFLLRNYQYALLVTMIVAAVATPTSDIPNMMMVAVPMLALYTIGIVIAYIFGKRKKQEEA
jgi:sec-independent protein translocase protein TatC